MARKIRKKPTEVRGPGPLPSEPLADRLLAIGGPVLRMLPEDPQQGQLVWAMKVLMLSWNCSREADETEGMAQLDRQTMELLTPAFPDAAELAPLMEEVFHAARIRFPRDPRYALKMYIEPAKAPTAFGRFHVEIVPGVRQQPR